MAGTIAVQPMVGTSIGAIAASGKERRERASNQIGEPAPAT
jgi:hypothetical protein